MSAFTQASADKKYGGLEEYRRYKKQTRYAYTSDDSVTLLLFVSDKT